MIVSLSFSPGWPPPTSVWAMAWCSSCSSCARPASKSASVICGVVDGSVPPPVAAELSTPKHPVPPGGHGYGLESMLVIVPEPTFPAEPAVTAITLTAGLVPPHATNVSPDCWANVMPLVLSSLCPYGRISPGLLQPACGQVGMAIVFL